MRTRVFVSSLLIGSVVAGFLQGLLAENATAFIIGYSTVTSTSYVYQHIPTATSTEYSVWTSTTVMTIEHTQFGPAWTSGPGGAYYWVKVSTDTLSLEIILGIPIATYTYIRTQTQTSMMIYTTAYLAGEPFTMGAIVAAVLIAAIGAILLLRRTKSRRSNAAM